MMNNIAIVTKSLSKNFKLYGSKSDRIKELLHPLRKPFHNKYHALNNINLQVKRGEIIGIIGKNGSGKSTLLKILASVVSPSSGFFQCNGRVTALLELGAGFNKDITGIENIYFLGAIQGFSKKEMAIKLPKILEFADIGEYAYQPVKSYSSGMFVRLAFSMAVNINPDILIIDEALSVGDLRFQQKCYRRIKEFKDEGKTILFCSHSLSAVVSFCTRALWINEGNIVEQGDPGFVTNSYDVYMKGLQNIAKVKTDNEQTSLKQSKTDLIPAEYENLKWSDLSICESNGSGDVSLMYASMLKVDGNTDTVSLNGNEKISILVLLKVITDIHNADFQIVVVGQFGAPVFEIRGSDYGKRITATADKSIIMKTELTLPNIANGQYSISAGLTTNEKDKINYLHWVHEAIMFNVVNHTPKNNRGTQIIINNASIMEQQL
jgi:teichoic acid transport system ATP-binding protein